jgi:hypothetical protein
MMDSDVKQMTLALESANKVGYDEGLKIGFNEGFLWCIGLTFAVGFGFVVYSKHQKQAQILALQKANTPLPVSRVVDKQESFEGW